MLPLQRVQFDLCLNENDQIMEIHPAEKDTFMLMIESGGKYDLVHIDNQGNFLKVYHLRQHHPAMGMLRDSEVVLVNKESMYLEKYDLRSYFRMPSTQPWYKTIFYNHFGVITFPQTNLVCLHQVEIFFKRIYLAYYDSYFSYMKNNFNLMWVSHDLPVNPNNHIFLKVNNHSKIGWLNRYQSTHEPLEFHVFDLQHNPQGRLQTFKTGNSMRDLRMMPPSKFEIMAVQEVGLNQFFFYINYEYSLNDEDYLIECFLVKAQSSSKPATMKIINADYMYEPGRKLHLLREFQRSQETGWGIVNFKYKDVSRCIPFAKDPWMETMFFMGWDGKSVIRYDRDCNRYRSRPLKKKKLVEVQLTAKQFFQMKDIYMHLLEGIDPDLDDDLLKDAIDLLVQ